MKRPLQKLLYAERLVSQQALSRCVLPLCPLVWNDALKPTLNVFENWKVFCHWKEPSGWLKSAFPSGMLAVYHCFCTLRVSCGCQMPTFGASVNEAKALS